MRVVIADDEALARERMRGLLASLPGVELLGEAVDGESVLRVCAEQRPDAVLLDIAMPGMDGLEVAQQLAERAPRPVVIFCTAYDQHAVQAFEAAAVDYLLKPIRPERLAAALDRARMLVEARESTAAADDGRRQHLCARLRGSLRLIPIEDVFFLRAEEKYVVVYHAAGEDLLEESLKSLEDEFTDIFVRIHRNCLVARAEIAGLQRDAEGHSHLRLRRSPQLLEVSRRSLGQLKDLLQHL